jgi:hypothetical protein
MTEDRDDELEAFFAAARAAPPALPGGLRAAVLADAGAELARRRPPVPAAGGWSGWSVLAGLVRLIGPGAWGGVVAAGLAGLSLGWVQSERVAALGGALWQAESGETLELFPSFESMLEDGDG